jgi:hypothetical protein
MLDVLEADMSRRASTLRVAFLVGAVTDGLALVPMLSSSVATRLWRIEYSPTFRFASTSAAALMFGWTALLIWAYRRPIERRAVAALTIVVVVGLAVAEVDAVASSVITASRMAPTWLVQLVLVVLFGAGLLKSRPGRSGAA